MKGYVQAQTTSAEQLASLRESQAELVERCRCKESELAEVQGRCVALEKDNQFLLSKVATSESEAIASRRECSALSEALSKLREAESTRGTLGKDLKRLENELAESHTESQAQLENFTQLQAVKDGLQSRVDELEALAAGFNAERTKLEQEATAKSNAIRLELADAAKASKEDVVFEYENKLHRVTYQKNEAEVKLDQLRTSQNHHVSYSQSDTLSSG